jgi:quercetin dioxygenase-like cupin family protein
MSDDEQQRLSFLDRPLPAAFVVQVVTLAAGEEVIYEEAAWRDALVVVENGRIELETLTGSRRGFSTGDVLCLMGISVRALHNRGPELAVLVAVSRRRLGDCRA